MKKQGKSGSPKKKREGANEGKDALRTARMEHARSQRTVRLMLRVIAWLMQHRDSWADEAKIPLEALTVDVDVGIYNDADTGHLLVVPAPPFVREDPDDVEMEEAMAAAAARPDAEGT